MTTFSDTDGPRFDSRRRVTTTFASDTRHLETYQPPKDAQHDPTSEHCFCPTCHLKTAHFPRRRDGRIMLPPPVPSQKTRSASSASVSRPYTQSESLVGSDRRGVVDVPMIATAAGLGPRKARRSASPNPPHSLRSSSASRVHKDANHRQSSRPSGSQYAQPIRSHVSEPYPSEVLPKAQRYASGESSKLKGKARMASSGAPTSASNRPPIAALDARWDHERQPFSHFLEPLPPLGTSIVHPKPVGPSRVSPEHIEPSLYPTLRTVEPSSILSPIPTGPPPRASSSRDEALASSFDMPPRPPSAPGDRPPSRFFRFRPELFDQYVEVPESCNVSIEATHMSYQDQCDADAQATTAPIAGPSKLTAMVVPEPSTSLEGARPSQPLPYNAHSKAFNAASERMDDRIGAFSFEKTITPPISQSTSASATTTAYGKAPAAPTSSRAKRNRSSDKYASGSNVQVKWDSERKRRQGYFAQDDGNEKSPFRHYNQTSCNFDP